MTRMDGERLTTRQFIKTVGWPLAILHFIVWGAVGLVLASPFIWLCMP